MSGNRAHPRPSEAMGPFGPAKGVPQADRAQEKLRAFAISVGILAAGVTLTAVTGIPAFAPVGVLVTGLFLARRAQVDLRPALFFAILAAFTAASLTTSPKTAKPARAATKQANTATHAASVSLVSIPTDLGKQWLAKLTGDEEQPASEVEK